MPPPIPSYPNGHTLDDDGMEELEKIKEKWDLYNQHEALIKAQILTTGPEATAVEIQSLMTGKKMWSALCNKHEKKALMVIVDLQHRMYALKRLDEGNVKTHMETLSSIYEQLKGMGEKIEDGDFTMLILAFLPKGYRPLINTISLQNHASTTPLKPRVMMESILEEFNRLQIEESRSKATEDAMLAKGGKEKGKKPRKGAGLTSGGATNPDVKCWTYGEKGHYKEKCPKKPKKKSGGNRGRSQEAHTCWVHICIIPSI